MFAKWLTKFLNHSTMGAAQWNWMEETSMRLSTVGRYALRAMVDLAQHEGKGPVLRKDIAQRQEISSDYLAQLFAKLRRAGLVESVLGPGGGYVLAKRPGEISAGDVLRAVDESLDPAPCVGAKEPDACQRTECCSTHKLWQRVTEAIGDVVDGVTLADLSTPHVTS
jgi:Rrf2 family iron-sulfur cluster assembly transcriptional regulator